MKLKNIDNMCAYLLSFLAISVSHYICVENFLTINGVNDNSVRRLKYLNFELTELTQIKKKMVLRAEVDRKQICTWH